MFSLVPLVNVHPDGSPDTWRSLSDDPQFLVSNADRLAGKWVHLDAYIQYEGLLHTPITIYWDEGHGFNETNVLILHPDAAGQAKILWRAPRGLLALRVDPCAQMGIFVKTFKLTILNRPKLFGMAFLRLVQRPSRLGASLSRSLKQLQAGGGVNGLVGLIAKSLYPESDLQSSYVQWVDRNDVLAPSVKQALTARLMRLKTQPKIAVIMPVYNAKPVWLKAAIESVKAQIYPHWELCIADDASTDPAVRRLLHAEAALEPRIKLHLRERNGHISACSNSALDLVSADYFATLDHDDVLREHALLLVAEAITRWPDARVFYSDEDKLSTEGQRCDPHFKCDWNPELLLSQNYLCHLMVIKTALARELGGFRLGFEGAQDHDLALRCTQGCGPDEVIHIPHILYHWRQHEGSTAQGGDAKPYAVDAGVRAVQEHLDRRGVRGSVEVGAYGWYRVRFAVLDPAPLVTLIIPTRNGLDILRTCIKSIVEKTSYPNFEIIIVDNGSDDPQTLRYLDDLVASDQRIRVLRDDGPFNYSALNNRAAKLARGDYLALVNNDVEVITPDWLSEMVSLAAQEGIGAVGARLWYANGTLQHGGVILGVGGVAGHSHKWLEPNQPGYMGRACLLQCMSAVTAACLVVRKTAFDQVNGLDEASLAVAFNDVDFCLRLRAAGYRNVWTPHAELFHHESVSRGSDMAPEKIQRFRQEVKVMQTRWGDALQFDPAYSPNLTNQNEDFGLAWVPRVSLTLPWFEREGATYLP